MYKPTTIDLKSLNATIIDLRSDAVSHPTQRMRDAMATAVVGDGKEIENKTPNFFEFLSVCQNLF